MNIRRFCILLGLLGSGLCYAGVANLTSEHRSILVDSARFELLYTQINLPPEIAILCADKNGTIAEPGAAWEATDALSGSSKPRKRLVWVAASDDYYVVHYERGGIGRSSHIMMASLDSERGEWHAVWRAVRLRPLEDYNSFLDALMRGDLDDGLGLVY
jgi:hypothetical protein